MINLTFEEFTYNLKSFLTEEKAYDKFIYNLKKNNKDLRSIYSPNNFSETIGIAFIWSRTEEGLKYWCKLHIKLKSYKIKKINYDNCWND